MIISKDIIDAKISARQAAEDARTKALWKAIEAKIPAVEALTSDLVDIIDTYRYLNEKDVVAGKELWDFMVTQKEHLLNITLCNGLEIETQYGIRPDSLSVKGVFSHLYVTMEGGMFGPAWDELYPLNEMKEKLSPSSYESMLNAMVLLLEEVPEYKKRIINKITEIIK